MFGNSCAAKRLQWPIVAALMYSDAIQTMQLALMDQANRICFKVRSLLLSARA